MNDNIDNRDLLGWGAWSWIADQFPFNNWACRKAAQNRIRVQLACYGIDENESYYAVTDEELFVNQIKP